MQKPKVAWILTHQIQYFSNLIEELHNRGNVEILTIYAHETTNFIDEGFKLKINWDNQSNKRAPYVILPDSAKREHGSFLQSRTRYLSKVLNNFKPDILHLNGYTNAIQIQAWIWAIRNKIPFLIRCDGDNLGLKEKWKSEIRRQLVRPITRSASKVMFQGEENRKFWKSNFAKDEKLIWIPCVPDSHVFRIKAFNDKKERQDLRAKFGATDKDLVFIVSGKLEARKRPQDVLKAVLNLKNLPIKLWYLGSGDLMEVLKTQSSILGLNDKITFLGFQNLNELPLYLQASDVLIHPSEMDPWPYAILEGAISGNALLLSNRVGSTSDWLSPQPAGLSFDCGNILQITEAMKYLIANPKDLIEFQRAAVNKADKYTESVFCEIFESAVFDSTMTLNLSN